MRVQKSRNRSSLTDGLGDRSGEIAQPFALIECARFTPPPLHGERESDASFLKLRAQFCRLPGVGGLPQRGLELPDRLEQFHFRRNDVGIPEQRCSRSLRCGQREIIRQVQRLPASRQVVEFASSDGFLDAAFSKSRPVHDHDSRWLFRQGEDPFVIEKEFQASEEKLGGDDIEIDRKMPEAHAEVKVMALQQREQPRRKHPHESHGSDVARQGIPFSAVGAEIDEVVPDEKERAAHGQAARRRAPGRQRGMGLQPLEGDRDEQVIDPRSRHEPKEARAQRLPVSRGLDFGIFCHRLIYGESKHGG